MIRQIKQRAKQLLFMVLISHYFLLVSNEPAQVDNQLPVTVRAAANRYCKEALYSYAMQCIDDAHEKSHLIEWHDECLIPDHVQHYIPYLANAWQTLTNVVGPFMSRVGPAVARSGGALLAAATTKFNEYMFPQGSRNDHLVVVNPTRHDLALCADYSVDKTDVCVSNTSGHLTDDGRVDGYNKSQKTIRDAYSQAMNRLQRDYGLQEFSHDYITGVFNSAYCQKVHTPDQLQTIRKQNSAIAVLTIDNQGKPYIDVHCFYTVAQDETVITNRPIYSHHRTIFRNTPEHEKNSDVPPIPAPCPPPDQEPDDQSSEDQDNEIKTDIDQLQVDKINHIVQGSKGSNHHWEELVPSKSWPAIKQIITEVLTTGQTKSYKVNGLLKAKQIKGRIVEVTYKVENGIMRVGDAWVT